jgi:hypothetical protein
MADIPNAIRGGIHRDLYGGRRSAKHFYPLPLVNNAKLHPIVLGGRCYGRKLTESVPVVVNRRGSAFRRKGA